MNTTTYNTEKINSKNKIVVYTCIVGNNDVLREVANPESNIDYVCFTNHDIQSKTWGIRKIPGYLNYLDPVKIARCIKIMPHVFLKEYIISVWVDGNIEVKRDINDFIEDSLTGYFAIPKHPLRICIYEEAKAVLKLNKDRPDIVNLQMSEYFRREYPVSYGLVQSGIIIRKHNHEKSIEICNSWWNEVRTFSIRDQLSFNFAIWKKDINIDVIHPSILGSNYFQLWSHISKGCERISFKPNYGDIQNFINGKPV